MRIWRSHAIETHPSASYWCISSLGCASEGPMIIGGKAWCNSWHDFEILASRPVENPDKVWLLARRPGQHPDITAAAEEKISENGPKWGRKSGLMPVSWHFNRILGSRPAWFLIFFFKSVFGSKKIRPLWGLSLVLEKAQNIPQTVNITILENLVHGDVIEVTRRIVILLDNPDY